MTKAVISGVGVVSSIGAGKEALVASLRRAKREFGHLQRPGREGALPFIGAEIPDELLVYSADDRQFRNTSLSARAAIQVVEEALVDADIDHIDAEDIGLVVGGSNFQLRQQLLLQRKYPEASPFVPAHHALGFMDTDLCGLCTSHFGIKGLAYSVGAASASSQVALIKAAQEIEAGRLAACVVVGALADLSYLELQAFANTGAMAINAYEGNYQQVCRPFDRDRTGFLYGESSAAVVLVAAEHKRYPSAKKSYALLEGYGLNVDGNRGPDPSVEGELTAIAHCLQMAQWSADQVEYVNSHGTGSSLGDKTESEALRKARLVNAKINASKSLLGHGLTAAGLTETVVTVLQMQQSFMHANPNLLNPVCHELNWVGQEVEERPFDKAITLSMGFGGVNSALALAKL